MLTPKTFQSFLGGLSDSVTGSSEDQFVTGDNLLYEKKSGNLTSRPGSALLDPAKPINARITSLWSFNEDAALLATSARQLWRWTNPGWAEVLGPTGNPFFSAGDNTKRVSGSDWKGHLFLTNDGGALPMKIYQDQAGNFKGVTAGLPRFLSVDAYAATVTSSVAFATLANNVRAQFIAHYANAVAHPTGADVTSGAGIPAALNGAGGDTFAVAKAMVDALQVAYDLHYVDARLATGNRLYHSNLLGDFPGEPNLPLEDDQTLKVATLWKTLAQRLNDLKKRFNWHVRSIYGHPLGDLALTTQGVTLLSNTVNGSLSLTFIGGGVAGAEVVTFFGTAITVQIQDGVSTVTQVVSAIFAVNTFSIGSLFPATPQGVSAAPVNVTGTASTTALVDAADLANTEEGPVFSDLDYLSMSSFANALKFSYSAHAVDISGPHNNADAITTGVPKPLVYVQPGGLSAGIINHALWVTLFDSSSTDLNSVIELVCHLYAAYRRHQQDAALPGIILTGTTRSAAKTLIDGLVSLSTLVDTNHVIKGSGSYLQLINGMFLRAAGDVLNTITPINEFPPGTTIQSGAGGVNIVASAMHLNAAGADEVEDFVFTKRVRHGVSTTIPNDPSIKTGNVQTLIDLMSVSTSPVSLVAVLLDVATCFNYHDSNNVSYHSPAFPGSQYQMDLTKLLPVHQYVYAWIYSHEYHTLSGEKFRIVSAPYFKTKYTQKTPDVQTTQITNMPTITQGQNNYDTANIKVEVYRTGDALTVPLLLGSAPLGVTVFADNVADAELQARAKLYVAGGAIDSDPPPVCNVMHITKDGTAYYGSVTRVNNDTSVEIIVNRVEQAITDAPEYTNAGNFDDLVLPVVGLSSVRSLPIAFTGESTYRLDGKFDQLGRGQINAIAISERIGLAAGFSPLQVDGAVIFAGSDQYYKTDGYELVPLGRSWPTTYAAIMLANRNVLSAFDKTTNRAFWCASRVNGENDTLFSLDLNFGAAPDKAPWTTWSNGTSFAPSALCFFKGDLIRGDASGYVFKHNSAFKSDPKIAAGTVTPGVSKAVVYNLTTVASDYGSDALRKQAIFMESKFQNLGNLSAQWVSINDQGRTTGTLTPIRARTAGQQIDEKRFYPAGNLWFADKQMRLTNAKVVLNNSDTLGLATVTGNATVTIAAGTWPVDLVDQVVAFAADGYVTEYPITAQNGGLTTLTVTGAPPNVVGTKWVLRGIPKDEAMQLQEFSVWATAVGANQKSAGGESGANK